jgi:hypothetical protein
LSLIKQVRNRQRRNLSPARAVIQQGGPKGSRNKLSEDFLQAFAADFEQNGSAVIEKVREERPQDYLRVAASLLPKQMEIETNRTRPLSEYSDAELMEDIANGIEGTIEKILVARGHAALTPVEREQIVRTWGKPIIL